MAREPFALVLHYLRTRLGPADTESATDGQLLERFARYGEIAAFEALLRRHSPLVWRVCRRVLAPARAVPFLAGHLQPAADIDSARVEQLLADLHSNRFALRTAAAVELAKLGEQVEPTLRQALESEPSAELRERAEALLATMRTAPPRETLRALRAIQVLERIGTPEAQHVLRKLAAGASGARQTRDAKKALERLHNSEGTPMHSDRSG
jgi:hypothetical protein